MGVPDSWSDPDENKGFVFGPVRVRVRERETDVRKNGQTHSLYVYGSGRFDLFHLRSIRG